jgi:hypothetical protein
MQMKVSPMAISSSKTTGSKYVPVYRALMLVTELSSARMVTIAPVASVVRKIEELTPEGAGCGVSSAVHVRRLRVCGQQVTKNDGCPFRGCLEEVQRCVPTEPSCQSM